jgi:hypothetical protein
LRDGDGSKSQTGEERGDDCVANGAHINSRSV